MNLEEYVSLLSPQHKARKEYELLKAAAEGKVRRSPLHRLGYLLGWTPEKHGEMVAKAVNEQRGKNASIL